MSALRKARKIEKMANRLWAEIDELASELCHQTEVSSNHHAAAAAAYVIQDLVQTASDHMRDGVVNRLLSAKPKKSQGATH